jgi:hypothetical protein
MTEVDGLLEAVAADAGLDDFGDPSFREGLEALLVSGTTEAGLNDFGRAVFDGTIRAALVNRLRVTDWHARNPSAASDPVDAPIFVVGISRSGTTALSHLLAADPDNRSLLAWEATDSVPPPVAATYHDDPRFVAAREAPDVLGQLNPGFKAIHHDEPDEPVECLTVLAQHFVSAHFSTMFNVPGYDDWLLSNDWTAAYRYHRQVLQVLQARCPGRWQLKSPGHAIGIEGLARVYPDARFVVTHRDPVKATASVFSLVRSLSGTFSDVDHTAYIARHWPGLVSAMLDRVLDFRDREGDERFFDLPYADLVGDPVGSVHRMYERFGFGWTSSTERALQAHASEHRPHSYGMHTYSLAEFGVDRADLEARYARYLDRFDVPREPV